MKLHFKLLATCPSVLHSNQRHCAKLKDQLKSFTLLWKIQSGISTPFTSQQYPTLCFKVVTLVHSHMAVAELLAHLAQQLMHVCKPILCRSIINGKSKQNGRQGLLHLTSTRALFWSDKKNLYHPYHKDLAAIINISITPLDL